MTTAVYDRRLTYYDGSADINAVIVACARKAGRSLHVQMYGITYPPLFDAILDFAALAGTDPKTVGVVTDRVQAAGKSQRTQLARLRAAGVDVVLASAPKGGIMHTKAILVDVAAAGVTDPKSFVGWGSHNASVSASRQENQWQTNNDPQLCSAAWARYQAVREHALKRISQALVKDTP